MSETYKPTLVDIAKLLYSARGLGRNSEAVLLLNWLVCQIPELRELWASVHEVRFHGVSALDLVRLQYSLVDEVDELTASQAYGTAAWLLRQVPEANALYEQLEQMALDATGHVLQHPDFGIEALRRHREVDQLLGDTSWPSAGQVFDVQGLLGTYYQEWVNILQARIARKEGDVERLKTVRDALLAEGEPELVAAAEEKARDSE